MFDFTKIITKDGPGFMVPEACAYLGEKKKKSYFKTKLK